MLLCIDDAASHQRTGRWRSLSELVKYLILSTFDFRITFHIKKRGICISGACQASISLCAMEIWLQIVWYSWCFGCDCHFPPGWYLSLWCLSFRLLTRLNVVLGFRRIPFNADQMTRISLYMNLKLFSMNPVTELGRTRTGNSKAVQLSTDEAEPWYMSTHNGHSIKHAISNDFVSSNALWYLWILLADG